MWHNKRPFILCTLAVMLHILAAPCFPAEKPLVGFGINLRYNPRTMYYRYQPLMDYLTQNTPYRFQLLISRDYRGALKDLKEGKALISSLGDGAFVEAIILDGALPIVKPLNRNGKPFFRCAIIVPRESAIYSLQELKEKRFAFGSYHSITGNLIPRYMLQEAGVSLSGPGYQASLKNHDAVTKAILKGQYDAGAVKEMFAEKYLQYGLRIVAYSPQMPSVPLVASSRAPKALRDAVAAALLNLDPGNPAHQKLMSAWDDEFKHGFAAASVQDYREMIGMFRSIPLGCGTRCH